MPMKKLKLYIGLPEGQPIEIASLWLGDGEEVAMVNPVAPITSIALDLEKMVDTYWARENNRDGKDH